VMVSSMAPTRISALIVDVKFSDTSTASRLVVENPVSVKVTV
jgi:hypothetical protein